MSAGRSRYNPFMTHINVR